MTEEETRPLLGNIRSSDTPITRNQYSDDERSNYRVSSHRWFILTTLSALNFSSGMLWITFSPIADITAEYYHVGSARVNWLSIIYMICCVPFGFVTIWMLDNKGLKSVIHTGAWLNCIGAAVRLISIFETIPVEKRYAIVMLGQTIAAIAQPFALFAPTKMAATWFPHSQRAKANMISSMANPIGIMTANILSPIIVKHPEQLYWVLEAYCVPAAITLFLVLMGVTSSLPPHPPSPSAEEPSEPFISGIKKILRNCNFWVLTFSFGGGVALFTSLSTLLEQILCPRGYSDEFAGICGALLFATGLLGAGVASAIVDKTKKFEETAKICFAVAVLFSIMFAFVSTWEKAEVWIALSISGLGCFGFAVYPVCLELSVESTYPVAEATSSGLLMVSGQVQSMLYILIMQATTRTKSFSHSTCHFSLLGGVAAQDFSVANWVFAGMGCLAFLVLTIFYKCDYRRMHAEQILMTEGLEPSASSSPTISRRPLLNYT